MTKNLTAHRDDSPYQFNTRMLYKVGRGVSAEPAVAFWTHFGSFATDSSVGQLGRQIKVKLHGFRRDIERDVVANAHHIAA